MAQSFACPHCNAEYDTDQVPAGSTFTCGACENTVTAPAPAGAPMGAGPARRGGPARKGPARTAAPRKSPGGGGNKNVLIIGGVVAIVAVVGLAFAFGGDDDTGGQGKSEPKPDPLAPALALFTEIESKYDVQVAQGLWDAAEALDAKAAAWKASGENERAINAVERKAEDFRRRTLEVDPGFAPMRERRGERQYKNELLVYIEGDGFVETDRVIAKKAHDRILRLTRNTRGWAKPEMFKGVDEVIAQLEPKRKAREALENSPFYKTAKEMETEIMADLEKRFEGVTEDGGWRGAEMQIAEPFVFFVQKDPSWDTQQVANSRSRSLHALQDIIIAEFGAELDLEPVKVPVPVLMFRSQKMYQKYSGSPAGVLAHFEPMTGRLAVHDDCSHTTVMHEGTHQLMWFWTKASGKTVIPTSRSYWFQEGIAEWYSTSTRSRNADNSGWDYEIGLVEPGRVSTLQSLMNSNSKIAFNLKELLQTTYGHRRKITRTHRTLAVYAQGWFLIYFLNHFNEQDGGVTDPRKPGIYAKRWREYVKAELTGESGLQVFLDKMGLDEAGLRKLEDDYWRYAKWIIRKNQLGAIKNKHVVHWSEQVNRVGTKVGKPSDDVMVPEVPAESRPPMDRDSIGGGDGVDK